MRESKFKKSLTIAISEESYQAIKQITDERKISIAEWFRGVAENALNKFNNKEEV